MVSPAGPTRSFLFLLCCVGTWLHCFPAPTPAPTPAATLSPHQLKNILKVLKNLSSTLLDKYKQSEMPLWPMPTESPLPCFTPGPEGSDSIAVFQAHLKDIKQQKLNNEDFTNDITKTMEHLDMLRSDQKEPEATSMCKDGVWRCRNRVYSFLKRLSDCGVQVYAAVSSSL